MYATTHFYQPAQQLTTEIYNDEKKQQPKTFSTQRSVLLHSLCGWLCVCEFVYISIVNTAIIIKLNKLYLFGHIKTILKKTMDTYIFSSKWNTEW